LWEAIPPAGSESHTGTEARSVLHEEAGKLLTEKLTRQDATDPKQQAVTGYKEQVDRPPPHPTPSTGKLKTGEPTQPQRTQQPGAQSVNNGPRK